MADPALNVIYAPMGTGKSTYLLLILAYLSNKNVALVAPNREVANGLYESLKGTVNAMLETKEYKAIAQDFKDSIGFKIDGVKVEKRITVMTPAYVEPANQYTWTVFDEFQTIRHYNKSYIEDVQNHCNLILMSATPFVPLLDALIQKGCLKEKKHIISLPSKREKKRWIVFGGAKPIPEAMPNRSVVFSTKKPNLESDRCPNYVGLRDSLIDKAKDHFWVHPTKVYAWNPGKDLKYGVISFKRPICVPAAM